MTELELIEKGAIYFNKIERGLEEYDYEIMKFTQIQAFECLKKQLGGAEYAFADFYYYRLEDEAREKVNKLLSEREIAYINNLEADVEQIIYPLDEVLLSITTKLNAAQMLYSTVYFINNTSTWWGNFNQEYVVFKRLSK